MVAHTQARPARQWPARLAGPPARRGTGEREDEIVAMSASGEKYRAQEYGGPGRAIPSQVVAGYLAALAIFGGLAAIVYYPGRIGLAAIVFAFVAVAIGRTIRRLTALAVAVATLGWLAGMIVCVFLDRPIF